MADPGDTRTARARGGTLTYTEPQPAGAASEADTVRAGDTFGRFVVLGQIGSGGLGVVLRAYDGELQRELAIKLVRPETRTRGSEDSERAQLRLVREARAIAQLAHPNVVSVYDVGRHGDDMFIAMEYVRGHSLRDWLRDHPRTVDDVLDVFDQAGRGLIAAHRAGLVHRDFKPSNVLVGDDGRVRVADFGLARSWTAPESTTDDLEAAPNETVTLAGGVVGTPAYMAPEQFDAGEVTAQADQFAFCVSLYEAVAGQRPFGERQPEDRPAVPRMDPARDVPEWLEDILRRGLDPDPARRFGSLAELLASIARKRNRKRNVVGTAAIVSLAAAAAVTGFFLVSNRADEPCTGFADQMGETWNQSRRAALRAGFDASGAPFAESAWRQTAAVLDDYSAAWIERRTATCRATLVHDEQSGDLMDLRMLCLDRRRQDLDALLERLRSPDRELVARSVEAAYGLSPVEDCDDVEALLQRASAPDDPAVRAAIDDAQGELAALKVAFDTGMYPGQRERADALLERVRTIDYPPLVAEAAYWAGMLRSLGDDRAGAVEALRRSVLVADAGRDDYGRLRAYLALAELDRGESVQTRPTRDHLDHAEHLLRRLRAPAADRARVSHARAMFHVHRGRPERALGLVDALIARVATELPDAHPERLRALTLRARILHDMGRRVEATAAYRRAEALAERIHGADHPRVAEIWHRRSVNERVLGHGATAEEFAVRALERMRSAYGPRHSSVARSHDILASAYFAQERYADALASYREALVLYTDLFGEGSAQTAQPMTNMGLTHARMGQSERARELATRSAALYERWLGPNHRETARAIGRIGVAEQDLGHFERAAVLFEDAMSRLLATTPPHPTVLDQIRGAAECRLRLGQPQKAWKHLEVGLRISQQTQEDPLYTAILELRAAQALWDGRIDRRRAVGLAESAATRFESIDGWDQVRREIADWLATHRR